MLRLIIALTLLCATGIWAGTLPSNAKNNFAGRIVNGEQSSIYKRPYQVSLQDVEDDEHICGGSIIAEDIIVTAAHCVKDQGASDFQVRLGSTLYNEGGHLVKVKNLTVHEKYNGKDRKYDVAVLKLEKPVKQSAAVRYIKLATTSPESGTPAIISGWGTTCYFICPLAKNLREVEVSFLSLEDCASDDYQYGDEVGETMVCAYTESKDSCQGDSGGPLVANGKLVGVVSWGQGCAFNGYPGVYADVSALSDWILETAEQM